MNTKYENHINYYLDEKKKKLHILMLNLEQSYNK